MKNLLTGILALAGTSAFANFVTNGSFELGPTNADPFVTIGAGSSVLTGWSVDSGSIDLVGNYWQASDGVRSVDLDGNYQAGQISQNLSLTAGNVYRLTFDFSGNPDGGDPLKVAQVSLGDLSGNYAVYDVVAAGNTHANMQYQHFSANFTAQGADKIVFTSLDDPTSAFGLVVDNVRVESVPEPMTLGILGLGIAAAIRRRK